MAENSSNIVKYVNIKTQKARQTLSKMNLKISTMEHVIIKLLSQRQKQKVS